MMRINIIGAGMAGLLAANLLRRHEITVIEKQQELPNNHHSVLRFRTPEVGNVLGIPFRKVNMIKTYVPYKNVVADSLSYSKKVADKYLSDRSIIAGTVTDIRYVAPPDLIQQIAKNINIKFAIDYEFYNNQDIPVISTIPMPTLMKILNYKANIKFNSISGSVLTATIQDCDAFISVLFPGPEKFSRATITENRLMIEFPNVEQIDLADFSINKILPELGITGAIMTDIKVKQMEYFKIIDIDAAERKRFQRWATVNYNIYSLGRYSTWRSKLLLDDLIDDIRKIESWIIGGGIK